MTLKGHNSINGDNPDFKKICVSYFFMGNLSLKFKNPSLIFVRMD